MTLSKLQSLLSAIDSLAVQFSAGHAPIGGITIAGKRLEGGEFIPGHIAAQATPAQKKEIKAAPPAPKTARTLFGEIAPDTGPQAMFGFGRESEEDKAKAKAEAKAAAAKAKADAADPVERFKSPEAVKATGEMFQEKKEEAPIGMPGIFPTNGPEDTTPPAPAAVPVEPKPKTPGGRQSKTFAYKDTVRRSQHSAEAYTDDGKVWRWSSNDRVVPLDAAADYGIPIDKQAQYAKRDEENGKFIADYRKRMEGVEPSAEQKAEMRAAFGPGQKVVNVLTSRTHTTEGTPSTPRSFQPAAGLVQGYMFSAEHAPAGGVDINGHPYLGGQWIPLMQEALEATTKAAGDASKAYKSGSKADHQAAGSSNRHAAAVNRKLEALAKEEFIDWSGANGEHPATSIKDAADRHDEWAKEHDMMAKYA